MSIMYDKLQTLLAPYREILYFLAGVSVAVGLSFVYNPFAQDNFGYTGGLTEEVHVHSDFLMYINDARIDFTDDKYQSRIDHVLLEDYHFHDNNDEVIHRHADGLTLKDFIDSLGYILEEDCITTDTNESYCSNEVNELILFVNGAKVAGITAYIPQEGDQILIYYGDPDASIIEAHLQEITDDACIYSGTCPERGTPPPEACGLTCEI